MRRYRFDLQVLFVLAFVAVIFLAAVFIRVVENPLGIFTEPNELLLYADDLQGVRERAEVRCRGTIVGHVKKIEWGTRATVFAGAAAKMPTSAPDDRVRFWMKAGVNNRFKNWAFAPRGHIQGAVMQSAMTPSWIELLPPVESEQSVTPGPFAQIELLPPKQKPGAEGLIEKVTEITDAVLELVRVINPSGEAGVEGQVGPKPTPPIQKIVRMIDDMAETSRTMRDFAIRVKEKGSDDELHEALQELKAAVTKLHEHVTEADGAVEETKAAMATFKKAAKSADISADKFGNLVDRVGDTTMGRMLIRKKDPTPTPTPRRR